MKIQVDVKVMPHEKCIAKNYKTRLNRWENGTVTHVKAILISGKFYVQYRVLLDRKGTKKSKCYPNGGSPLILTVAYDGIEKP